MTDLKTEIQSGPLAAELAQHVAAGNDAAIADILNRRNILVTECVDRGTFAMWCGSTGLRAAIQDHAGNVASPLRAIALTLLDFLQGGVAPSIDLAKPANQMMLAAWVQAGAITAEQRTELLAMATHVISRAEQMGITITELDIRRTIWADDGSKLL